MTPLWPRDTKLGEETETILYSEAVRVFLEYGAGGFGEASCCKALVPICANFPVVAVLEDDGRLEIVARDEFTDAIRPMLNR